MLRAFSLLMMSCCLVTSSPAQKGRARPTRAAPQCSKGIPCGSTCISADKECHIGSPSTEKTDTTTRNPGGIDTTARNDTAKPVRTLGRWVARAGAAFYFDTACAAWRAINASDRVYFLTEERAKKAGYVRSRLPGC